MSRERFAQQQEYSRIHLNSHTVSSQFAGNLSQKAETTALKLAITKGQNPQH
jgi:hypothetical protein